MNDRYRQIEDWLDETLGGRDTSSRFELNETTISILTQLMQRNKLKNKAAEIIVQDLQQKSGDYLAEAERLSHVLHKIGVTPSSLSASGSSSLRTVQALSLSLGVQSPSTTNLLLAMNKFTEDNFTLEERLCKLQTHSSDLLAKTNSHSQRLNELKQALQESEEFAKQEEPAVIKKADIVTFLQTKSHGYLRSIQDLTRQMQADGVDPSIYHASLKTKSDDLEILNEKLLAVKSKLDSYHELPPDISLAKVKIEEAKRELASLQAELSSFVDLTNM